MKSSENDLRIVYLFIDLLILNTAIALSFSLGELYFSRSLPDQNMYWLLGNLSWVITYFLFVKRNLYLRDAYTHRVWRISKRILIFFVISSMLAFLITRSYSRVLLLEYTGIFYLGELVFYRLFYIYLKHKREKGFNTKRALIVGLSDTSRFLRRIIESNPMLGYRFMGYASAKTDSSEKILGNKDELVDLIQQYNIHVVFVSLSIFSESNRGKDYLRICNQLGVRLFFVPENQQWLKTRANLESLGELLILNPQSIPLDDLSQRILKRLFDLAFSAILIVFLFSWLFPIIMLLIKLESKGSVFFVQKRTGINNRTFKCLKFRSMVVNNQADELQASPDDARITRMGKWMRRTNVDELPQFLNVFWGQMSVVGPRPHMIRHTKQYSELIEHYLIRHYVKPGVTGWAQVCGYRGNTDELWKMEKRVEYDMEYIENWSFWWDIKIIAYTLFGKNTFKNAG